MTFVSVKRLSLRAKIIMFTVGMVIVGLFALVTFLSRALERTVFEDAEAFLRSKAHSIEVLLHGRPWDPQTISEELDWRPETGQYLILYTQIEGPRAELSFETRDSAWFWTHPNVPSQYGFHRAELEDGRLFILWAQGSQGYSVRLAMDMTRQMETLKAQRWILQLVFFASVVVTLLIGSLLGRIATQPIDRLVAQLASLSPRREFLIDADAFPNELRPIISALKTLHHDLSQQMESLSRFAGNAAHELRNPINILMGEAELALSKPRSNEEYRETLVSALEEYRDLSHLIEQLLFIARAERGTQPVHPTWQDARGLAETVIDLYEGWASERKIVLINRVPEEMNLYGDATLLKQAVANLVANSIRYGRSGGHIWLDAGTREGKTFFSVSDDGPGISQEDASRVFERFFRSQPVETHGGASPNGNLGRPKGSGLGLSIVKSIMDLHHGSVVISAREGGGAVITLTF